MSSLLRKLTIGHFRGACQPVCLEFKPEKKIALISGNNGTGKSTICDALEMIGCSQIGSIGDKKFGGAGTNKKTFLPSLDRKETDVKIELASIEGNWTATLGKKEICVAPSSDQLDMRVLRRSNILRIVEANGTDRYQVMREFLDLSKIEAVERALREAATTLGDNANSTATDLSNSKRQLEDLWHDNGSKGETAASWAATIIEKKSAVQRPADLKPLLKEPKRILNSISALNLEFSQKQKSFEKTAAEQTSSDAELQETIAQLASVEPAGILDSLESVLQFLKKESNAKECPVCSTPFRRADLISMIEARLIKMKAVQLASVKCKGIEASLTSAKSILADVVQRKAAIPDALTRMLAPLQESADTDAKMIRVLIEDFVKQYQTDDKVLPEKLLLEIEEISAKRDKEAAEEDAEDRLKKQLERLVETIASKQKSSEEYVTAAGKADKAVKITENERKRYVDEVLVQISTEVNTLFSRLHPDEKLGGIRLSVKERGQGSVEMTSDFHGKSRVPPEAFFSDSHLDTLGICVFVALAKANGNSRTVLVLDDVVSSIDRDHLSRLVQLISDEASNFGHVIITTHLEILEEWFRHNTKAANQTQFERIAEWNISSGFRFIAREFQTDLLRSMIGKSPLDKSGAGQKAGSLLEVLLNQITLSYRVPMPRVSPVKYSIGEYLQALNREIREDKIKVDIQGTGKVSTPLSQYLDPIENTAWIRNVVDHGNIELNAMLPEGDVKQFGDLVLKLNDEFCCNIPEHKKQLC